MISQSLDIIYIYSIENRVAQRDIERVIHKVFFPSKKKKKNQMKSKWLITRAVSIVNCMWLTLCIEEHSEFLLYITLVWCESIILKWFQFDLITTIC